MAPGPTRHRARKGNVRESKTKKKYFVAKETLEIKKKESCREKKTVKLEVIGGATGNYPGVGAKER